MAAPHWDQTTEYLSVTNTNPIPGVPAAYAYQRRTGNSDTDVTGYHPGMHYWSRENLPDILYWLEPPLSWHTFRSSGVPKQKRDANGALMFEPFPEDSDNPRALLDFAILPDKIGTSEEWWVLKAIRRYDPRVRGVDIEMRMESERRPKWNAIQTRTLRTWNPSFAMLSWHAKGKWRSGKPNAPREAILAMLTPAQKEANTTWGTTPGLINPALGEAGGRIPWPSIKSGQGEARKSRKRKASPPDPTPSAVRGPAVAPTLSVLRALSVLPAPSVIPGPSVVPAENDSSLYENHFQPINSASATSSHRASNNRTEDDDNTTSEAGTTEDESMETESIDNDSSADDSQSSDNEPFEDEPAEAFEDEPAEEEGAHTDSDSTEHGLSENKSVDSDVNDRHKRYSSVRDDIEGAIFRDEDFFPDLDTPGYPLDHELFGNYNLDNDKMDKYAWTLDEMDDNGDERSKEAGSEEEVMS